MSNVCPKGHFSTDPDYCSDCGAPLHVTSSAPVSERNSVAACASRSGAQHVSATAMDSVNCPDCMTPRPDVARYCEVCRFDFVGHQSFSGLGSSEDAAAPSPSMPVAVVTSPTDTAVVATRDTPAPRLLLRIVVDPTLNQDPDPQSPCPSGAPERIFHLDLDENTLGRQYQGNGLHPEIVVQDPGISRRHLKFVRGDAGGFSVLELGSANGTEFNAKALEPGIATVVQPGDQLTLGMWTRVHVQAR